MNKFRLILIILFLIFCQGCQTPPGTLLPPQEVRGVPPTIEEVPPDIRDGGLISDIPCAAPCFFGITPGISSNIDVIQNLKQNGIYSGCRMDNYGLDCLGYVFNIDKSTLLCETISFNLTDTVTISELIKKFGKPDLWDVEVLDREVFPQTLWLSVNYNSHRMLVYLESQEKDNGDYALSPNTKINSVSYYSKEQYHFSGQKEWPGYGVYEVR